MTSLYTLFYFYLFLLIFSAFFLRIANHTYQSFTLEVNSHRCKGYTIDYQTYHIINTNKLYKLASNVKYFDYRKTYSCKNSELTYYDSEHTDFGIIGAFKYYPEDVYELKTGHEYKYLPKAN